MKLKDRIRFVRQNMAKTKSRVFMTVLATAMGCAFLIVLASVGFGLQKSLVDEIVGDRLVTEISLYGKEDSGNFTKNLVDEDLAYFRSLSNVKTVTTRLVIAQDLRTAVEGRQQHASGPSLAMDFSSELKAGFKLSAGRVPSQANEVVIGYDFLMRFKNPEANNDQTGDGASNTSSRQGPSPAEEWLDKNLTLTVQKADGATSELTAKIVGITTAPSREWKQDIALYMDHKLLNQIEAYTGTLNGELPVVDANGVEDPDVPKPRALTEPRTYNEITIIADHLKHVKGISQEIRELGYLNHSIANELDQVNIMFTIMNIGLIFVGTIAVLIASIGIYNTMTMAVTERTQDIGIMKAIGAHPKSIRAIFLLECAFIGVMGAAIGALVSYGISYAANAALPLIIEGFMDQTMPEGFSFSRIPPYLTALSVAISLGVAILSGYRPAVRATRIDVLKALRRDM